MLGIQLSFLFLLFVCTVLASQEQQDLEIRPKIVLCGQGPCPPGHRCCNPMTGFCCPSAYVCCHDRLSTFCCEAHEKNRVFGIDMRRKLERSTYGVSHG